MRRRRRMLSGWPRPALTVVVLLAACVVRREGQPATDDDVSLPPRRDDPVTRGSSSGAVDADATPRPCRARTAAPDAGQHFAGTACVGCHHGNWPGVPELRISGTLYESSGRQGAAGALVEIEDAVGRKLRVVTGTNGNFSAADPVTYPLRARVAACPEAIEMHAQVASPVPGSGSCNDQGCHDGARSIRLPPW